MYRLLGLILAGGIVLGHATESKAQFALSIGNPYSGGIGIGSPFGGYGYPYGGAFGPSAYGVTTYSSGYAGYVAPGTTSFYSGYAAPVYSGYVAPAYPVYRSYGYGYRPYSTWGRGFGRWRGGRPFRW